HRDESESASRDGGSDLPAAGSASRGAHGAVRGLARQHPPTPRTGPALMAHTPAEPPPEYEDRIILFIDFLAFKEIVEETRTDPKVLHRLVSAMDALAEIGDDRSMESQRVSQFSDSIVVSYRVDETSGVFWLLMEMAWAVIDLAHRGYLLRGAVTRGPLFHSDRHVVGPAMVKAHLMESKVAEFPRVIVDPELLKLARQY